MSKTALSAKLDDSLLAEADGLARRLKIPRNRAIEEGLRLWVNQKSREVLAAEMKAASLETRGESLKASEDWQSTLTDGLDDES